MNSTLAAGAVEIAKNATSAISFSSNATAAGALALAVNATAAALTVGLDKKAPADTPSTTKEAKKPKKKKKSEPPIDTGVTAFMFVATALVQFMTPGLALFYAGMTGYKSVVQLLIQNFVALGIISVLWSVYAFSLTFGEPMLTLWGYHLIGNPFTYFLWTDVGLYTALHRASTLVVCCFPGMLFASYQLMFAVITPALISGGFVDRLRFGPWLVFISVWLTVVYAPLGFWNWGGGWMFQIGAWDFAGGMVVHESAGFSAMGALIVMGPREFIRGKPKPEPHSMAMILLGTAILWFGWFGFNGGSALSIGGLATIAFVNTQLAPAAAMMTWIALDWIVLGKPTLNGACAGVVAGLVVITPGAGFMQPQMAILAGIIGTIWCFSAVEIIKHRTNLDDACDTFGVHGMAGFLGTLFVGILSDPEDCLEDSPPVWCANPGTVARSWKQFLIQLLCGVVAAVYSAIVTYVIMKIMVSTCYMKLSTYDQQQTTTDVIAHGERGWVLGKIEDGDELEEDGSLWDGSSTNPTAREEPPSTQESSEVLLNGSHERKPLSVRDLAVYGDSGLQQANGAPRYFSQKPL